MLQVKSLHSHYGLSHVLQGIDFELKAGEVFGVFGRNGVGKTTLLKNIAGWVKPSSGSISAQGIDITGEEPDAVNRAGIALVPEDRRIFPGLSVRENMELGLLGRKSSDREGVVEAVLERFPRLKEREKQAGTTLSGGEQQMLAIARIMVADPQIVLIDEPSEGLAPMIVADVFAAINQMRDEGKSVLLVEQNIHEALAVCDRFIVIERGKVVFSGDAENDADQSKLLEIVSV